mmetsp:Transcript_32605/g.55522  ORF Transcript_32605/g.55522 Transcript_32605/m.55522 type:complete len:82 (+) Transcript_32605:96-341(+)
MMRSLAVFLAILAVSQAQLGAPRRTRRKSNNLYSLNSRYHENGHMNVEKLASVGKVLVGREAESCSDAAKRTNSTTRTPIK